MTKTGRRFFAQVGMTALALAIAPSAVSAATYSAGNETQLRDAITAANGSADPTATILLTGSFTVTPTDLPAPTKSITIDTQGFVLSGVGRVPNVPGNIGFVGSSPGAELTIVGTFVGGNQNGAIATGQGLFVSAGSDARVVNNGSITGGNATTAGRGGIGATMGSTMTFENNGTISGGKGVSAGSGNNGSGVNFFYGGTLINNAAGVIRGGSGQATGSAGAGVFIRGTGAGGPSSTFSNYGEVYGGSTATGTGNAAVLARGALTTINNFGLLQGGNGAAAISVDTGTWDAAIVNSGKILAGAGSANAILFGQNAGSDSTLELWAGSQIEGKVVASALATGDVFRLGGTANASFDISALGTGATAQYQNFDSFEKVGASTWTLTGTSSFSGPTDVIEGTLSVNGSLASSVVSVQSGATLAGNGTVGATTLLAGGRIAPGNSIGTLTINGAFVQNAGSIYRVEVDPATATSDLIKVNGTATLVAGAGLSVVNYTGVPFVAGQNYTILTSTGLTGTYGFGELVLTPFLSLRDRYDANNAYLTVIQTRSVGDVGTTPNETEVGKGVDSLPATNPVQTGMLNEATLDAARRALGQLSGEIHSSIKTAAIETSHFLRDAATDRIRDAFCGVAAPKMPARADECGSRKTGVTLWGQAFGSWGRTGGDGNASTLDRSTGGFFLGGDAPVLDNWRAGVLAGYSRSEFDVKRLGSSGHSDDYHFGAYAGSQWGPVGLRFGASHTWHEIGTGQFLGQFATGELSADYQARTTQLFADVGYRFDLGRLALEPYANLAYVNLDSDGFTQRGGAAALAGRGETTEATFSTLGLRAATNFALGGVDVALKGALGWRHLYGDDTPVTSMSFASGSAPFNIAGVPIARDAVAVEAGADIRIAPNALLGISYGGQFGDDMRDQTVRGNLRVVF